jgi:hypothetical protein
MQTDENGYFINGTFPPYVDDAPKFQDNGDYSDFAAPDENVPGSDPDDDHLDYNISNWR